MIKLENELKTTFFYAAVNTAYWNTASWNCITSHHTDTKSESDN